MSLRPSGLITVLHKLKELKSTPNAAPVETLAIVDDKIKELKREHQENIELLTAFQLQNAAKAQEVLINFIPHSLSRLPTNQSSATAFKARPYHLWIPRALPPIFDVRLAPGQLRNNAVDNLMKYMFLIHAIRHGAAHGQRVWKWLVASLLRMFRGYYSSHTSNSHSWIMDISNTKMHAAAISLAS
ncbi:hypothetical protein DFJ58DRAFT_733650 [Suillus subalutaceus]|uniref:uncharacterized protein n=1 Tax=Suillus subalutaceus TaxID=48586 RepID=UPI001B85E153|nr:uncharacterized protein DFJ58DRAFT_733650 [Suillus subalutaceus]KAG1838825.1 hypothetical protein DFJ58DRAFT_733650 [Suillus subalutaceus]